jgi:hypothetical protein
LRVLLQRRDQHNQRLYRDITRLDRDLALTKAALYRGVLGQVRLIVTRFLAARRQNR